MKKLLLALAAVLCLEVSTQAEVFIYKSKMKHTITGGGGTTKLSTSGWVVINESGQVTQVLAYPAQKKYAIVPMESIEYGNVDAGGGKQYSYFVQRDQWFDGNGHLHIDTGGARGMNSTMTVNGESWSIPKRFTWGGRAIYPADSGGSMQFEESSGTFSFDSKWTNVANAEGDTRESAADRLAAALEQKGYQFFE